MINTKVMSVKSLRSKIFVSFILCVIVPWLMVSSFLIVFFTVNIRGRYINDAITILRESLDSFYVNVSITGQLLDSIFVSEHFNRMLVEVNRADFDSEYRKSVINIDNYLNSFLSSNNFIDGVAVFADRKLVTSVRYPYWGSFIQSSDFFDRLYNSNGYTVYYNNMGLIDAYMQNRQVFLIGKPIKMIYTDEESMRFSSDIIGSVVMLIDTGRLLSQIKPELAGNMIMALMSSQGLICSDINEDELGTLTSWVDAYIAENPAYAVSGSFKDNTGRIIIYSKSKDKQYMAVGAIDAESIYSYANSIALIAIFAQVFCVAAFLIFTGVINRVITAPINKLKHSMGQVTQGNLDVSVDIRTRDEIGQMCESFNFMINELNKMITQIHKDYEIKSHMEMSILQYQINPHFIFNILSSIRLKALMYGDTGVADMLNRVSRLFRKTIGKTGQSITVLNEIENIEDYVFIYKNIFTFEINVKISIEPGIEGYYLPNMTLQPIVENCFVHGASGQLDNFLVSIKAFVKDERLVFTVSDDGIGMDEQTMRSLLRDDEEIPRESFTKIGVNSVNKRIKLIYGDEYGIRVDSKPGLFTKVTVELPIITEPGVGSVDINGNIKGD